MASWNKLHCISFKVIILVKNISAVFLLSSSSITILTNILKNMFNLIYLWNVSCSEFISIWFERLGLTFSFSFSSSCWLVSMQYSAVHSMLQIRHCSSSVNLVTSPSFRMLWIKPDAELIPPLWFEALHRTRFVFFNSFSNINWHKKIYKTKSNYLQ